MPIDRSEIQHINDTLLSLSRQLERVSVTVEKMEKSVGAHAEQLDNINTKFVRQEAVIGVFSKIGKLKPAGFIFGLLCALFLVFVDFFDFMQHTTVSVKQWLLRT